VKLWAGGGGVQLEMQSISYVAEAQEAFVNVTCPQALVNSGYLSLFVEVQLQL